MIWLIGGTSESVSIAKELTTSGFAWLVTVTTQAAVNLYQGLPGQVEVGSLTVNSVSFFLEHHAVAAIVDASHPFAVEISKIAITMAQQRGIPYLRFERSPVVLHDPIVVLPSVINVLQDRFLAQRRVLLTVGVKALPLFQPWLVKSQIWARILPSSWDQAQAMGFLAEQLIGLRLPLTLDQERELWQSLKIDTVICKASGVAGGLEIKQQVALDLGVQLIVIDRPVMAYPQQTNNLTVVLDYCTQYHSKLLQSDR